MKRIGVYVVGAVLAFIALSADAALTSTVVDFPAPNGRLRYLDVRPDAPYATLIAFAGGSGVMGIQDDGTFKTLQGRCSAVGRNRQAFAEHGYEVVLVNDVASASTPNIQALIDNLRQRANVPVWLVGISSSTELTAELAASLPTITQLGVAFLSPIPLDPALLATIRRPSLVLINNYDAGQSGSQVYSALTAVPARKLTILSGGTNEACDGNGYHVFYGIEAAFVDAITAFVDQYNDTLTVDLDLNQHGLTGSWFERATDGQGIEIEVFPNLVGPGTSLVQGAWFTFEGAPAGGADRERWFTFNGNGQSGVASVAVTIFRNVGGNLNAMPVTQPTAVGTGTLAFADCSNATLAYTFTDGSGRTGSIALTRLTPNVTCTVGSAPATNADFALSGNWFDAATAGQGIVVEVNPASPAVFLTWYTYAPAGQASGAAGQRWFVAEIPYTVGTRTFTMPLFETTGGVFDQPTVPKPSSAAVGTATLSFASCTAAQLTFNFTAGSSMGRSGTILLRRVGPVPPGCTS
jgi:hypothetical protein